MKSREFIKINYELYPTKGISQDSLTASQLISKDVF